MIKIITKTIIYLFLYAVKLILKPFHFAIYLDITYNSDSEDLNKLKKHRTLKIEKKRKTVLELCYKTYLYREN